MVFFGIDFAYKGGVSEQTGEKATEANVTWDVAE